MFYPDGKITRKQDLCDCEMCISGNIEHCFYSGIITDGHVDDEDDADNLDDDENEDGDENADEGHPIFDIVVPGQVVSLRTPPEEK